MQAAKLEIPINIPVEIALASFDGVSVPSSYGPTGQQIKFSTVDGKSVYLYPDVADRVKALGAQPGEKIRLCKRQKPGGQRGVDWEVVKLAGEQPDGTFAVPKLEEPATLPPPRNNATGSPSQVHTVAVDVAKSIAQPSAQRKRFIWDSGKELIDAHAALMKYAAEKHGGSVTRDDVRAYVVTVFIQMRQGGRR